MRTETGTNHKHSSFTTQLVERVKKVEGMKTRLFIAAVLLVSVALMALLVSGVARPTVAQSELAVPPSHSLFSNPPWSSNVRVNDDEGMGRQYWPDIAVDENGKVYAVWSDHRDYRHVYVYFAERSVEGDWGPNVPVTESGSNLPAIAVDGPGNAYILVRGSTWPLLRFIYRSAEGSWSENVPVDDGLGAVDDPAIAVDGNGGAYAVWADNRNDDGDIYFAYRPSDGDWGANIRVNDDAIEVKQTCPSIAVDPFGNAYAVWADKRSGDYDIYSSYRPAGGNWRGNTRVNDSLGTVNSCPTIVVDSSGNAYVVWGDNRNGGRSIYFAYRPKGDNWSLNVRVEHSSSRSYGPDIAVDPWGNAYAIWVAGVVHGDIHSAYRPAGGEWGPSVQVNDDVREVTQTAPAIAVGISGNAYAVWSDFRNETRSDDAHCPSICNFDIYFSYRPAVEDGEPPCELSKQPVLFVHGWHGGAESLQEDGQLNFFIDYFGEGYAENCNLWYAQGVSETNRLHQNAEGIQATLRQAYDYISAHNPSFDGHFDIIAHSMGGINSRAYLESELYQDDQKYKGGIYIDNFFTLGTPHGGAGDVPIALFYGILRLGEDWPSIKELSAPHMLWFNLQHSQPEGVCYRLLGGNVNVQHPYLALLWSVPNDLLASQSSAHALTYPPFSSKWPRVAQEYTPDMHGYHPSLSSWRSYVQPRTTFDNYIKGFLGNTSCLGSSAMALGVTTSITESTSSRVTPFVSGVITTSQSLTGTLSIDSSGHTGFYLVWYEGDLDFTLVAPDDTVMDTTTAEIDSNVSFLALDALLNTEMYVVTDTLSGTWTFTATAVSLPYTMPYAVYAVLDTPINLALSTAEWYPKGSAAVITATLRYSSTALTGASMQAEVSRPDGVTETIALLDDGIHNDGLANNGVYGNSYTGTDVGGYYGVIATASGNYLGQDYQRAAQTIFTVSPGTASLSGAYSDQGEDADNNGLYEYLVVQVGLDVTQAGDYSLAAVLEGPGGQYIDHAMRDIALGADSQVVALRFDGDTIRGSGLDGPYTVTQVLLTDNSEIAVKLDEAHNVWATAAYDHRQFGSGWHLYLPIILRTH